MKTIIKIENLARCGCANAILKSLNAVPGVYGAKVSFGYDELEVDHTEEVTEEQLNDCLSAQPSQSNHSIY